MPSSRHATNAHANPSHAHAPVSASASLPASAYNFHLNNSFSTSNSNSNTNSNFGPTSRSASQATIGRKPLHQHHQQQQQHQHQQQQHQHQQQQHQHQQQQYYDSPARSTHHNSAKPSHITNNAPHISSAVNFSASHGGSFSAASLPRSSSLLPPPHITADDNTGKLPTLHDPFANSHAAVAAAVAAPAATSSSNFASPTNDRELDDSVSPKNTRRRPSKAHSRSSSLGGLSDGFRNLNRWSISTSSSRASNAASTKRFSRRMSVDSTTLFSQSSSVSPRRLLKSRPSTAGGSPEDHQPSIPPLTTLPPIIQLPSLSQDDLVGAALSGFQAEPKQEHVTQLPGSGAAEINLGRFWDDSTTAGESSYMSASARATPDQALPTSAFSRGATMPRPESAAGCREKGHSRSRSQGLKSSQDSTSSSQRNPSRSKQPSQKAMLSKALQKANTAVQLDNAQNFEGARSAYQEACDLLHQVLLRTAGDEDKKKLDAIRVTYSSRIEELDQMLPEDVEDSKALPQRPTSNGTGSTLQDYDRTRSDSVVDDDRVARLRSDSERGQQAQWSVPNYARPTSAAWRSQHSPKPSLDGPRYVTPTPTNFSEPYNRSQSAFSQASPRHDRILKQDVFVARPMDDEYMPPPLSPRRPISPTTRVSPDASVRANFSSSANRLTPETTAQWGHEQEESHDPISWLDPIDESGGSSASSVHSRSSSKIRRRHIRSASGDTEAEFDAALDDAIEAAYDDGYEPEDPTQRPVNLDHLVDEDDVIAQALRKVQLARDRVRQSELEMQRLANDRGQRMKALQEEEEDILPGGFYDGDDSEEEERILEELTTDYAMDDFSLGGHPPASISAVSKPPTTSNTVLSPVTEVATLPSFSMAQGPTAPPPSQSLPKLPPGRSRSSSGRDSVRDRRLSGTNAKQLKIETQTLGPKTQEPATAGPMMQNPELPMSQQVKPAAGFVAQQRQTLGAAPSRTASLRRGPSPIPPGIAVDGAPPTPPLPAEGHQDNRAGSPSMPRPPTLHRNFSSNSLKSIRNRNLSISNVDDYLEVSPGTPMSNPFANSSSTRLPALPSLPTPVAAAFRDRITSGSATGGFRLFDNDIHTPASPGEPNGSSDDAPFPLEPCPTDVLLRPFWLMRALYQTLAHPKGGYISTKLFVPRDAWRVKGVKIKNMEEKIGQCDLLTAALQKLARVNSEDADAVLEEMQSLETVLEQAQAFLTRRLGNEVGVQTAGVMFRDADGVIEGGQDKSVPRNNSVSNKGAFSWRRLRSKTSSTNLGVAHERGGGRKESTAGLGAAGGLGPDAVSLPTLPMTNYPTSKPSKRDVMGVQFSGPNAHYMAALARLFDAAQTVDQIARQVEDPGLRHADKTQVGLELCTRHASEFFAFYICRFVLQDLTLLMDKFIKRGSEWVLV